MADGRAVRGGPLDQLRAQAERGDTRAVEALRTLGQPTVADPVDAALLEAAAALPSIPYQPPPNLSLGEVTDRMAVTCHVSPDAGWATLGKFLGGVKERLTIGMYDLSAPHVVQALEAALGPRPRKLRLVLDPQGARQPPSPTSGGVKANDLVESEVLRRLRELLGPRLEFVWAAVAYRGRTTQAIYPNAYHIKLAVRDGKAFWLSSGNWQSSNQPDLAQLGTDAAALRRVWQRYNREWHVVVEHPGLASLFEGFLDWDIRQAKPLQAPPPAPTILPDLLLPLAPAEAMPADAMMLPPGPPKQFAPRRFRFTAARPLRVRPILTPDNYAATVLELVRSATSSIRFQNQYIDLRPPGENASGFLALLDALLERTRAGVDVRIIIRNSNAAEHVTELTKHGFDRDKIRIQSGCHTKGIVVDGQRVLLGSHNWSNQGTLRNRDASLIFYSPRIAEYYQQVFDWDWANQARPYTPTLHAIPLIAWPDEPTPDGMLRVGWDDLFEN